MFDFFMSIILLLFVSMILSTVVGSRPETLAKFIVDIVLSLLAMVTKAIPEYIKLLLGVLEFVRQIMLTNEEDATEKRKDPFPKKPKPKDVESDD